MNFLRVLSSQLLSFIIIIILGYSGNLNGINAFKWIPLKTGDQLPENSILVYNTNERYVGRARHFDEILPAEIYANGTAFVSSCNQEIRKEQFEILTAKPGDCEWKNANYIDGIDETVVRVGTAWNNEPIFIASHFQHYNDYNDHIDSVYLTANKIIRWAYSGYYNEREIKHYLSCNPMNRWIDASAMNLPNNTIYGGKSDEDYDIYVARLKRNCQIVVGQVMPQIGSATAVSYDNDDIEAAYCQVLVGEPGEYTWVSASDGEIPDYAVVSGKYGDEKMSYTVRINNTIGHLTYSRAFHEQLDFEVLVMNHSNESV